MQVEINQKIPLIEYPIEVEFNPYPLPYEDDIEQEENAQFQGNASDPFNDKKVIKGPRRHHVNLDPSDINCDNLLDIDFTKVRFDQVKNSDALIKRQLNRTFSLLSDPKMRKVKIHAISISIKTAAIFSTVGAISGGLVGAGVQLGINCMGSAGLEATSSNKEESSDLDLIKWGCISGALLGLGAGILVASKKVSIIIKKSQEYKNFKDNLTAAQYNLFLNAMQRYLSEVEFEEAEIELGEGSEHFDNIGTFQLIEFPVMSPYGDIYEYESIVTDIHRNEAKLQTYLKMNPNCTKEQLEKSNRMTDPYGHPLFKEEDLVYASNFVQRAIPKFRKILEKIKVEKICDPLICHGLQCIVKDYIKNDGHIKDKLFSELKAKLVKQAPDCDEVVDAFLANVKRHYKNLE